MNTDIKFNNILCDIEILSENQYSKKYTKKLKIKDTIELKHGEDLKDLYRKNTSEYEVQKKSKIVNTFISIAQENEKRRLEEEKERLLKVNKDFPYIKSILLTNAEKTLYKFMKENLSQKDRVVIFTKVRLGDIVQLDRRVTNDMTYFWKVTNKHVDYVICREDNLELLCVVELDDYTHDTKEACARDDFKLKVLESAGIKLFRIKTKIAVIEKSDLEDINNYIDKELAPLCPYCGIKMIPKRCTRGSNKGHKFYGCVNYSDCSCTINIDEMGVELP